MKYVTCLDTGARSERAKRARSLYIIDKLQSSVVVGCIRGSYDVDAEASIA